MARKRADIRDTFGKQIGAFLLLKLVAGACWSNLQEKRQEGDKNS